MSDYDSDVYAVYSDWLYESLLQYLASPMWKIPISSFVDENCIVFDNEEENKFSFTDIHKKFTNLVEQMLGSYLDGLGVTMDQIEPQIVKGLKSKDRKIFQQLLIVDDFITFKKMMVKRNKELECEALKLLEENEEDTQDDQSNLAFLEKEKAELEFAIAMSLLIDEEMKKLALEEEKALKEALELSQQEYLAKETKTTKGGSSEITSTPEEEKKNVSAGAKKVIKLEPIVSAKNIDNSDKIQIITTPKIPNKSNTDENNQTQYTKENTLPILKPDQRFDELKLEEIIAEKEVITKKLDNITVPGESKQENAEERKKRLLAQRDIILAKKKAEREAELQKYIQSETSETSKISTNADPKLPKQTNTLDPNEIKKRALIYEKLKSEKP